jgi:hypothetical protein
MYWASMPETTVHHDRDTGATEDDVNAATPRAEQGHIHSVAQTSAVEFPPQCHLRRGVASPLPLKPCAYSWRRSARHGPHNSYFALWSTTVETLMAATWKIGPRQPRRQLHRRAVAAPRCRSVRAPCT